jgi:hypothetical protein
MVKKKKKYDTYKILKDPVYHIEKGCNPIIELVDDETYRKIERFIRKNALYKYKIYRYVKKIISLYSIECESGHIHRPKYAFYFAFKRTAKAFNRQTSAIRHIYYKAKVLYEDEK